MDIFYLSDDIFIKNNTMFFINNNKNLKINKSNWHKYLRNIGWEKLNRNYISQLNKLVLKPNKNSLFGILDCGGDGNCLFNCIEYAYNNNINTDELISSKLLRSKIATSINNTIFNDIISYYKILHDNNEIEYFNPYKTTLKDFKKLIQNEDFWCDYILINQLINILKINIIILFNNNDKLSIYNTLHKYDEELPSIIIYYLSNEHFQLIGYFNKIMHTWFTNDILPNEIKLLLNIK